MLRIMLLLCGLALGHSLTGQSEHLEDLRAKWKNACAYTLEIAELMPAEQYTYQPTEEQMTFSEQLIHIMRNMTWLCNSHLGAEPFSGDLKKESYTKEEVVALFKEVTTYTQKTLDQLQWETLSEPVSFFTDQVQRKGQVVHLLHDHHTHHRGQLLIYLRLNDIQPPRYRGW